MKLLATLVLVVGTGLAAAQNVVDTFQPRATTRQLMVDAIHPASNDLLLVVYRGAPVSERDWAAVRRSALALAESGNLLMMRGRVRDQADWLTDARRMSDVGSAAYTAAQAKDLGALAALTGQLDASCTACHLRYRPNVFPRDGGGP
jgi:cytochrome c556